MARPRNLQTKGFFSVIDFGNGNFKLVFRNCYILDEGDRSRLYRVRIKYSYWFSRIVALLKLTKTDLGEV